MRLSTTALIAIAAALPSVANAQTDMLPDIIVDEERLYDHYINVDGSVVELRLSNGTANVGDGPFEVRGGADNGDGTQQVHQRVYRDDGSHYDVLAGNFIYHPTHGHVHLDDWARYRLREILPGDGVGDIVAEGAKTSFCILDLGIYDTSLPNYDPSGEYFGCGTQLQGLSVGWIDVYSSGLTGQSIDITGLPEGEYWLESVVDADNVYVESDDTNNTARIKVTIGDTGPGDLVPDEYEPNDSASETASRPVGAPNSPNLGPTNPEMTIEDLTIDTSTDEDFYRFYMPATGTGSDFVRITFSHALGDLDMRLRTDAGSTVDTSQGTSNAETISLSGVGPGWYVVEVYGWNGDTSPAYDLTINPGANSAPSVSVLNPPAGDIQLVHGAENYTVTWSSSDPESNETWVTVYANTSPSFDGNEILLPTSVNTDADLGMYVVNSAYLLEDTYWFYTEITDGGSTSGDWSEGTLTFVPFCAADLSGDGATGPDDLAIFVDTFVGPGLMDFDGDGDEDADDIAAFVTAFVAGC